MIYDLQVFMLGTWKYALYVQICSLTNYWMTKYIGFDNRIIFIIGWFLCKYFKLFFWSSLSISISGVKWSLLCETCSHHVISASSCCDCLWQKKSRERKWTLFQRVNMSPEGLRNISGEQWLFGAFSAADSSYTAIQEMVNVQRGSERGNNQFNSFLQGGEWELTEADSCWEQEHFIKCCVETEMLVFSEIILL